MILPMMVMTPTTTTKTISRDCQHQPVQRSETYSTPLRFFELQKFRNSKEALKLIVINSTANWKLLPVLISSLSLSLARDCYPEKTTTTTPSFRLYQGCLGDFFNEPRLASFVPFPFTNNKNPTLILGLSNSLLRIQLSTLRL